MDAATLDHSTDAQCSSSTCAEAAERASVAGREVTWEHPLTMAALHDLAGPLTVIGGQVALLRRHGADPVSRERGLRGIEQAVLRLERLRRDLLDLAVLGTDRFILRRERTDLMEVLREVVGAYEALSPDHTLLLQGPESVWGLWDQDRLARVVHNLLTNALKYSPDGREIRVSASVEEDQAHLEVADQGIGIAPEDLGRVFAAFERMDAADGGGTGLGLFISRQIVEAHGGRMWAESGGAGRGARLHVRLPLELDHGSN